MTTHFVLDCSVTMSWCFEDEFDQYTDQVLGSLKSSTALVPSLWILEVTNVLLMAEKKGRLKPADSVRFLELLKSLPIYVSDLFLSASEVINIARSNSLTSYDASYLLLAMHDGIAIATKDKALVSACNNNGVLVFDGN